MGDRFYTRAQMEAIVEDIVAAREAGDRDGVVDAVKTLVKYHGGYTPLGD